MKVKENCSMKMETKVRIKMVETRPRGCQATIRLIVP